MNKEKALKNQGLEFREDITQGGGHGGSHPHLVHEFIRSILEERKPAIDDIMGAYWTGTGICAHESAMKDGEVITIPRFE